MILKNTNLLTIFIVTTIIAAIATTTTDKIIWPGHFFISCLIGLFITFLTFMIVLIIGVAKSQKQSNYNKK